MYYVYKLLNESNQVVWVGETTRPKGRLWQHTSNNGKFTGQSLNMEIITGYTTRKEAWYHQVKLQKEYGLETDLNKTRRAGSSITEARAKHIKNLGTFESRQKGGLSNKGNTYNVKTKTCPHCNLTGKGSNMTRYHFDNCKWK